MIAASLATLFAVPGVTKAVTLLSPLPRITVPFQAHPTVVCPLVAVAELNPMNGTLRYLGAGVVTDDGTVLTAAHVVKEDNPNVQLCLLVPQKGMVPIQIHDRQQLVLCESSVLSFGDDVAVLTPQDPYAFQTRMGSGACSDSSKWLTYVWDSDENGLRAVAVEMQRSSYHAVPEENAKMERLYAMPLDDNLRIGAGNSGSPLYVISRSGVKPLLIGIASVGLFKDGEQLAIAYVHPHHDTSHTSEESDGNASFLRPTSSSASHPLVESFMMSGETISIVFGDSDTHPGSREVLVRHLLLSNDPGGTAHRLFFSGPNKTAFCGRVHIVAREFPSFRHIVHGDSSEDGLLIEGIPFDQGVLLSIEIPAEIGERTLEIHFVRHGT